MSFTVINTLSDICLYLRLYLIFKNHRNPAGLFSNISAQDSSQILKMSSYTESFINYSERGNDQERVNLNGNTRNTRRLNKKITVIFLRTGD